MAHCLRYAYADGRMKLATEAAPDDVVWTDLDRQVRDGFGKVDGHVSGTVDMWYAAPADCPGLGDRDREVVRGICRDVKKRLSAGLPYRVDTVLPSGIDIAISYCPPGVSLDRVTGTPDSRGAELGPFEGTPEKEQGGSGAFVPLPRLTRTEGSVVGDHDRLIAWLEKRFDAIDRRLSALEANFKRMAAHFEGGVKGKRVLKMSLPQQEVCEAVEKISGTDARARKEAERELRKLASDRITEELAGFLKRLLKDRGWGIVCPKCHRPAAPTWQKNHAYAAGGFLQFQHPNETGGYSKHGGQTKLGELKIVEYLDARRAVDVS